MSKSKNTSKTANSSKTAITDTISDTKISVISHKPFDDSFNNYLVLAIQGSGINHVIVNTLRRTIMELVPTYAFDKSDIEIRKNTSIYNNDYMRLRLSHFPVIGIENPDTNIDRSAELEYEANISTFEKKIEDLSILEEKEKKIREEKASNLVMFVNVKNSGENAANIMNVTTDDPMVKFYYNGKIINSPYKQKLLIIKLKPGEEFNCTATSTINIGLKGANFMPNSVCTFAELDSESDTTTDKKIYHLNLESLKQMTEKDMVLRACAIIDKKLENFLNVITSKIREYKSERIVDTYNVDNIKKSDSDSESDTEDTINAVIRNADIVVGQNDILEQHRVKGVVKIENESHTFGNLLSRMLQDHPHIMFAGYKIDHLLIKELTIGYKTDDTDIIDIFTEIITKARSIYTDIKSKTEALKI